MSDPSPAPGPDPASETTGDDPGAVADLPTTARLDHLEAQLDEVDAVLARLDQDP